MFTQTQKVLVTGIIVLGCLLLDLWLWRHGCPQWVTVLMTLALGLNLGGWWRGTMKVKLHWMTNGPVRTAYVGLLRLDVCDFGDGDPYISVRAPGLPPGYPDWPSDDNPESPLLVAEEAAIQHLEEQRTLAEQGLAVLSPLTGPSRPRTGPDLSSLLETLDWKDTTKVQEVIAGLSAQGPPTDAFRRFLLAMRRVAAMAADVKNDPVQVDLSVPVVGALIADVQFSASRRMLTFLASAFETPVFPPLLPLVQDLDWTDPGASLRLSRLVEGRPYTHPLSMVLSAGRRLALVGWQYTVLHGIQPTSGEEDSLEWEQGQAKERLERAKALFEDVVRRYDEPKAGIPSVLINILDSLFFDTWHFVYGSNATVPALAGWKGDLFGNPAWICEILSPETERNIRVENMDLYRRQKVTHVWLVSPSALTLEVFGLQGNRYTLLAVFTGDDTVLAEPFDAIAFSLERLWQAH